MLIVQIVHVLLPSS